MSSGLVVVKTLRQSGPASLYATPAVRAGGSTPAERVPIWEFDDGTSWYIDFLCYLLGYGGNGLSIILPWTSETATSGTVRWRVAIRRMDTSEDVDTSHSYSYQLADGTAPAAAGRFVYTTVALSSAQIDSWANDELATVRVGRDITVGGNMADIAQLAGMVGKET